MMVLNLATSSFLIVSHDDIYHPRRGCVLCDQASVQQASVKQL